MHELEAKFLTTSGKVPEDVLRRLQESLAWAGFRIQPQGRRAFTDRYFDTADHQLRSAGWSYRERSDEQGRRIALTEVNRSRAAIFDREEVEQPLSHEEDVRRPRPGPVRDRLSNLLHPDAKISPLFTVENQRAAYRLSHPDHPRGLVEMAFDDARIHGRDEVAFKELAIELKSGPHDLLASILAAVELESSLIGARLSKFERGLIAAGCPLERRRSLKPGTPGRRSRWLDVAVTQLKTQLFQMKLFEPYAWESLHVEGVHQMRVAIRRARAALRAFSSVLPPTEADRLAKHLRWLADALGGVRDLDVHLAHLTVYEKRLKPFEQEMLGHYRRHLQTLREAAHRKLIVALGSDEYDTALADFRALLESAVRPEHANSLRVEDVAQRSVAPLLNRVHRRGRHITDGSTARDLHRLRIDVKRLRYQLEFLQGAYEGTLDAPVNALRILQDRLGKHQDASVARTHLARYKKLHAVDPWERSVFKSLIKLEKRRARRHRRKFAGDWERFEAASADLTTRL